MSLLLYLAQEGRATTHRDTGLEKQDSPRQSESRAANLKKKRKEKKEKERGRQLGHGSPPSVQETAHSSGTRSKRGGERFVIGKADRRTRQRGGKRKRGVDV